MSFPFECIMYIQYHDDNLISTFFIKDSCSSFIFQLKHVRRLLGVYQKCFALI